MGLRPNAELVSNTQSLSPMAQNHDSDPYIKLKLKLKIKFPQSAARLGEIEVSEPDYETVIDKEYPENIPVSSAHNPSVIAYDRADHVAKYLPEPVEEERKFEKLHHSGRDPIPYKDQEIAKSDDSHLAEPVEDVLLQTTQIEDLLDNVEKYLLLRDLVSKLTENSAITDHDQSSSEAENQASEHHLDDQNTTPKTAYGGIEPFTENLSDAVEKIGNSKKRIIHEALFHTKLRRRQNSKGSLMEAILSQKLPTLILG
uniref:Dystrophin n=1 Tax=Lygus hesperus TaxID=30085 RepID=A0A0A9WX71_LYGHE